MKHGFHSIVTYTTRPMRKGEISDVTYHYISNEEFLKKIDEDFFVEWEKYRVGESVWYYGTAKEDIKDADEKSVIILTPDGVIDILKYDSIKPVVIYLYSNIDTIRKRLSKRNDNKDKAEDRIKRDAKDFKYADLLANKIVYNNDGTSVNEVVDSVINQYRKVLEEWEEMV
uniref:Guanylate kinase n=1 Tax=Siphoviridae sp. ctCIv11 TaxID=2827806 RepID=A0A8S5S1F0_9CAUD|nr:MAG TPA: Guanylate kinase [Siphoviridae sp. ctCIv11]